MLVYRIGQGVRTQWGDPGFLYDVEYLRPPHQDQNFFNRTFPCAGGWRPMAFGEEGLLEAHFEDTGYTLFQDQTAKTWDKTLGEYTPFITDVNQTIGNDAITLSVDIAGAGSDITLTVNDVSQTTSNDTIATTQERTLTVNDVGQSSSCDAIALIREQSLVVADCNQTTSNDAIVTTQERTLVITDGLLNQSTDAIALTRETNISIADVLQTTSNDAVILSVEYPALTVNDVNQTISNDAISAWSQQITLSINDVLQTTTNDNIANWIQQRLLSINDVLQTTSNDSLILPVQRLLSISDVFQGMSSDSPALDLGRPKFDSTPYTDFTPTSQTTWDYQYDKYANAVDGFQTIWNDNIILSIVAGITASLTIADVTQTTRNDAIILGQQTSISVPDSRSVISNDTIHLVGETGKFKDTGYTTWQETSETTWDKETADAGVTVLAVPDVYQSNHSDAITLSQVSGAFTTTLSIADVYQYIDSRRMIFQDRTNMTWDGAVMTWDETGAGDSYAITLSQESIFAINDTLQSIHSDEIDLDLTEISYYNLSVNDVTQTSTSDTFSLLFDYTLDPDEANARISNDAIALTQEINLSNPDVSQRISNDSITLNLAGEVIETINVADGLLTISNDAIVLGQQHKTLTVADVLQTVSNDAIQLIGLELTLIVNDVLQSITDAVDILGVEFELSVSDVNQAISNDEITLDTSGASFINLSIDDVLQTASSDSIALTFEILMSIVKANQTITNDSITGFLHDYMLTVYDGRCDISDSIGILPGQYSLSIADVNQRIWNDTVYALTSYIGLIKNPSFMDISIKRGFNVATTGMTHLFIQDITNRRQIQN